MKVGLARHFNVPHSQVRRVTSEGFIEWCRWYDDVDAPAPVATSGAAWDACYSSDLPRASSTARVLFPGVPRTTPQLREVPFAPVVTTRLRLPLIAWQALSRAAWYLEHGSQPESRSQTRRRVRGFLGALVAAHAGQRVLLVSHGLLMQVLATELQRGGLRGRLPIRPDFGRVYVFQSDAAVDPSVWSRGADAAI